MSVDINSVITEVEDLVKSVEAGDVEAALRDVSSLVTAGADILASLKGQGTHACKCEPDHKAKLEAACDRLRSACAGQRTVAAGSPVRASAIDWQGVLKLVEQLIPVILSLFVG